MLDKLIHSTFLTISSSDVRMMGFDLSSNRSANRQLWAKTEDSLGFLHQTDTKLYAVYGLDYDDYESELLEIDPRTGKSSRMFSVEGYVSSLRGLGAM